VILVVAALLAGATSAAQEPEPNTLEQAVVSGDPGMLLRYRYEFVDQESFEENAHASTLLLRLNYKTEEFRSFSGFVEFDQVLEVGLDDFNSAAGTSSPGRSRYPVVADPNGSDLNQLYLQFDTDTWLVRAGRQRIVLDDRRFIGGVVWRQNEQTYDGISITGRGFKNTTLFYSHIRNVNRIFGSGVPAGDNEQDSHFLNVNKAVNDDWSVTGYAYLIDNSDVPEFSTDTFGLRVEGSAGPFSLLGEVATQSDAANNPARFDADYLRLRAMWSNDDLSAGIGWESLGSDNNQGFRTPLATLYAFNGWADQFLATPATGLEDLSVHLGYQAGSWDLAAILHNFSAAKGGSDYAQEFDLSASRPLGDRYTLLLRAAVFEADAPAFVDTVKGWLMLTARF